MGTQGVHAVVDMQGLEPVQSQYPVELLQNALQIVDHIIPAVGHMAGVEADAQLIAQFHPVNDGPQLFKGAAHLAALARHGLQQHCGGLLRP